MLKIKSLSDYLIEEKNISYNQKKYLEEILFPFKILSWKKLSERGLLPKEYNFFDFLTNYKNKNDFLEIVKFFSASEDAKELRIFLSSDIKFLKKYDEQDLIAYINRANFLEKYPECSEFFNFINESTTDTNFFSEKVFDFIVNLMTLNHEEKVYNPYPNNYQLALKINKLNLQVFTEDNFVTSLPYILNVLYDANLKIAFSEPLINPFYKEGYTLRMFDVVVSYPPIVRRLEVNLQKDIYNRFNFKEIMRAFPTSAYVLHILAQAKDKAYVIVPISFLNRSFSVDMEFRKLLLERNLIDTVILLPENISNRATISCAMIVFNKQKQDSNILFINSSSIFKQSKDIEINHIEQEKILHILNNRITENELSCLIEIEDLKKHDFSLNPKSYLESKKFAKVFQYVKLTNLSEKFEIISSPLIKRKDGDLYVYELQPTDIDDFGVINRPKNKKNIYLTDTELKRSKIRKSDVLLVTKGIKDTIGKTGIVIEKPEDEIWIAGQSMTILRATSEADAKALFMFLLTNEAKELLNSLTTGSLLLNISARSLREMKIPEFDSKKLENLYEAFIKNYKEIEQIKSEIKKINMKTSKIIRENS